MVDILSAWLALWHVTNKNRRYQLLDAALYDKGY